MPITRHNRVIKQYRSESKKLTKENFLKALDAIIAKPILKPSNLINCNMQFDDAQVAGTLDQVRSEIDQINKDSQLISANSSLNINSNPRKSLSFSINVAQNLINFNANNFSKTEVKPLLTEILKIFPELETTNLIPTTDTPTTESIDDSKKGYLPGPFSPIPLSEKVSDKKVFVIMSFKPEHRDAYFVAIEPTLLKLGFEPIRVDQIQHNKTVTSEIVNQIEKAAFVVGDLTGERPNVYYEIGWAHRADKEVVLVARKGSAVHFDVSAINRIEYEDYTELCSALDKRIRGIAERLGLSVEDPE